jgi:hypothetical protein
MVSIELPAVWPGVGLGEFFAHLRGFGYGAGLQYFEETVDECGSFENGLHEKEAAARVGVVGDGEQCTGEIGVATEAFGAGDEPEVELVLGGSEVGDELGVIALGVVDEVAGMDLKELCEEKAGGVGEMRTCSALDLGEVRLANGSAVGRSGIGLNGADKLLLGHGAIEATEVAFDFAKIADFVAEFHLLLQIAIFISQFAIYVKRDL